MTLNQPLIFVKPEISELGDDAESAFHLIESTLKNYGCEINGIVLLGADYLRRHGMIEAHYGIINRYSVGGYESLPAAAKEEVSRWRSERGEHLEFFGAHELLALTEGLTAVDLLEWHQTSEESRRLASGAFGALGRHEGRPVVVINGFHPIQLDHFYQSNAPIVIATLRTDTSWRRLRREMIGATDPAKAGSGSLRSTLLLSRLALRLQTVDSLRNGVHLSAGPLEGAVEVRRYLTDYGATGDRVELRQTNLGAALIRSVGDTTAEAVAENVPFTRDGSIEFPFDLTEELNSAEALTNLVSLVED